MEYNIDRNGYGGDSPLEKGMDPIIELITSNKSVCSEETLITDNGNKVPIPDILIISEIARDCKDYGSNMNGVEYLAKRLNMSYAYVVEFIELG
jgi:hypothetical protein